MNGICLMTCVQEKYRGNRSDGIVTEKYIGLSKRETSALDGKTRSQNSSIVQGSEADILQEGKARSQSSPIAQGSRADILHEGKTRGQNSSIAQGSRLDTFRADRTYAVSAESCQAHKGKIRSVSPLYSSQKKCRLRHSAGRGTRSSVLRILLLAVVFAFMLAGLRISTRAFSRPSQPRWKYYTTVEIGCDEDFNDVVRKYCGTFTPSGTGEYIKEVCEINSLPYRKGTVPNLGPGTRIVVPYWSAILK